MAWILQRHDNARLAFAMPPCPPHHARPDWKFLMEMCLVKRCFAVLFALCSLANALAGVAAEPFELKNGDRVVLLGGTFIEREGNHGYIETALKLAWPDDWKLTFRNLGWSGDTVWADSRGIFDPPAEGYKRMISLVTELKPTVVVLAYGANESFAGEPGLAPFVKQFEKLCDDLKPTNARLVFVTPPPFEKPKPPLPDVSQFNANLGKYAAAVRELVERRNGRLVDLFGRLTELREQDSKNAQQQYGPFTADGVTFTPYGYFQLAFVFGSELRLSYGHGPHPMSRVVREGFCWDHLSPRHPMTREEQLRLKIVEKNQLFFHRWRPQNITYLTGFRKHEQGNNAGEIAQFDPLVEKAEKEIAELLKP